jgi:hypothetical protein
LKSKYIQWEIKRIFYFFITLRVLSHKRIFNKIYSFKSSDESNSNKKGPSTAPGTPFNQRTSNEKNFKKQTEQIKNKVRSEYFLEDIYRGNENVNNEIITKLKLFFFSYLKVIDNYSGFGINNDLSLEKDDIVGVLKKSDPCGNPLNWFVDNGIVKGIVVSSVLAPIIQTNDQTHFNHNHSQSNFKLTNEEQCYFSREPFTEVNKNTDRSVCNNSNLKNNSFKNEEDQEENIHNYVNCETLSEEIEV